MVPRPVEYGDSTSSGGGGMKRGHPTGNDQPPTPMDVQVGERGSIREGDPDVLPPARRRRINGIMGVTIVSTKKGQDIEVHVNEDTTEEMWNQPYLVETLLQKIPKDAWTTSVCIGNAHFHH